MSNLDYTTLCLFDVDGTLTPSRQKISNEIYEQLEKLKKKCVIGIVGGSDLVKISEQMNIGEYNVLDQFKYVFSENGLVAHKNGKLLSIQSIAEYMGEDKLQDFINFALNLLSQIRLPCKRGNFIEFRSGLINICPIGRSCSQVERDQFSQFDKEHNIRINLVNEFEKNFNDFGLKFSIGGQISIDVFPIGWDKRYCLNHLKNEGFKVIHFFGDKTQPGGNDYEIFMDERTVGHTVTSPKNTMQTLDELFNLSI